MKNTLALKWARNPVLAVLLLVTLCARALVPTGYMPGVGGLVFCQGMTAAQRDHAASMGHDMSTLDMSGPTQAESQTHDHGSRTGDHDGSSICPFAAAATSMASGHAPSPTVSTAGESETVPLPDPPFVPGGTRVPARLPRGPPPSA